MGLSGGNVKQITNVLLLLELKISGAKHPHTLHVYACMACIGTFTLNFLFHAYIIALLLMFLFCDIYDLRTDAV
jgi:hypothetical protein